MTNAYVSGMQTDVSFPLFPLFPPKTHRPLPRFLPQLKLYGNELNLFSTFFNVGYISVIPLSAYLLNGTIRPSIWLPVAEIGWGLFTGLIGTAKNAKTICTSPLSLRRHLSELKLHFSLQTDSVLRCTPSSSSSSYQRDDTDRSSAAASSRASLGRPSWLRCSTGASILPFPPSTNLPSAEAAYPPSLYDSCDSVACSALSARCAARLTCLFSPQ